MPLDTVAPYCHEEADTRIFVHARDAILGGTKSLIIKANDTNVVIIAVSVLPSLQKLGLQSMWIAFGQGASAGWIQVHEVVDHRKLVGSFTSMLSLGVMFFLLSREEREEICLADIGYL